MAYTMITPSQRRINSLVRLIFTRRLSSRPTEYLASTSSNLSTQSYEGDEQIDDPDIFGTLSTSGKRSLQVQSASESLPDDPDGYDKIEFDIAPRKNAYYYKYEIPKYARQGPTGLKRALELFKEMKSKDRLKPTSDNFSTLIFGCAKAGYTKRAFDLYEESLRYFSKPTQSVVTCLINACAESPFPDYGLQRLEWLLTHIKTEYNWQLNEIQYNCTIKAYGKFGQLEKASKIVQEMLDNGVTPSVDTFNMLLIACVSDKDSGCAFALRVFKRLKMYNFAPNVVTYRLLLRCIRDCEMGSAKLLEETIQELPAMTSFDKRLEYKMRGSKNKEKKKFTNFEWVPLISDMGKSIETATGGPTGEEKKSLLVTKSSRSNKYAKEDPVADEAGESRVAPIDVEKSMLTTYDQNHQHLPNLLSDDHLDLMFRIKSIQFDLLKRRPLRLMLFGGPRGYLETMVRDRCQPDAKTFSIILHCLERRRKDYLEFHQLSKDFNIQRDLSYYDQLIREVCDHGKFRGRLNVALEFVEQMHLDDLRPSISTFEVLAGGCDSWSMAQRIMDDVRNCGFVVSSAMIVRLLSKARKDMNFNYLNNVIDYCIDTKFKPLKRHIEELENLRLRMNDLVLKKEKGDHDDHIPKFIFSDTNIKNFERFQQKLKHWLEFVELGVEDHPWRQFKVDTSAKSDGFKAYKRQLEAMDQLKNEAIQSGRGIVGNLASKAEKLVRQRAG